MPCVTTPRTSGSKLPATRRRSASPSPMTAIRSPRPIARRSSTPSSPRGATPAAPAWGLRSSRRSWQVTADRSSCCRPIAARRSSCNFRRHNASKAGGTMMSIFAATKRRLACSGWVALLSVALPCSMAHAQDAFYQATAAEIENGAPGSIIREEPMRATPPGGAAHRVLYRSTSPDGKKIAVSGVIITPPGAPPQGGWPVVAWAHPTTGIVPRCAPSLALFVYQQMAGSRPLTEKGYAIAATDYPGLGTPGPHPYLVGISEARAVIDSVRVAAQMPGAGGDKKFVVLGHSQGGHAALFTGIIGKAYAPELDLLGVAAAAPATDLVTLMNEDIDSVGGKNITAMTLWSWQLVFDANMDKLVDRRAIPVIDQLAEECIEGPFDIRIRQITEQPLEQYFLTTKHPSDVEPWHRLLAQNSPGTLPPGIPVFLAQGTDDVIIDPKVTQDYAVALCGAGSKVRMLSMPNIGHGRAAQASTQAMLGWTSGRFAGTTAPDDCSRQ